MRKNQKLIVGNWKMNPTSLKEAEKIFTGVVKNLKNKITNEVVICPPYVFIEKLSKIKTIKIKLGAQDAFYQEKGAYTGEVSFEMLDMLKVKYVIVGHSERRSPLFGIGESNQDINKKIKSLISVGITPILCVGEKERDQNHQYLNIIQSQILECLAGLSKNNLADIVIAYEPVWAIGIEAKREANPEEFREVSIFIKKVLNDKFKTASVKILYGGSVHIDNAEQFLTEGNADGFLIGRDSLDPKKFVTIINICE